MITRPSVGQRCPKCRTSFRVLEDEYGQHACPRCGYCDGEDICATCGEESWDWRAGCANPECPANVYGTCDDCGEILRDHVCTDAGN